SDVLIRSAGADSTRAPIGAPPPFFYWGQRTWEWRWQSSGAETRRVSDLAYPPPRAARGRGTILRSKMVEGVQPRRFAFIAGVSSRPALLPACAGRKAAATPPPL